MKTYAEHIASLEATRAEKSARMKEVHKTAVDEGRTMNTAEKEEFDTLKGEIKEIDADLACTRDLDAMDKAEKADKATAKPVDTTTKEKVPASTTAPAPNNLQLKNTEKLEPGIGFARVARVKALAFTGQAGTRDEAQIAKHLYPGDDRLMDALTQRAPVEAANTISATWAGNLINDGGVAFADFVEWLRARTLYGQVSDRLRRLPFDTPVLIQGSAGSAKWTKEGDAKPLTKWTYTRTKLTPLKVAAIAAATKETLMRASLAADILLRDELGRSVGSTIDGTFISADAAVTDESPAGLLNGTAALTITGDGTVAGIRCDISAFLKALVGDSLTVAGSFWVMPETVAIDLSLIVNEVGAPAFPGITPTGGTLAGLPVFTSQYVPTDSDGAVVALIKGDEIFLGDEGGIQVSVSDQASLVMDSAPTSDSTTPTAAQVVSMWQTNSVAFLVERFINWQKRRSSAVVWAQVNWTACPS